MKKILLTMVALAGFAILSSAQDYGFEKGNVLLEGSFQYSKFRNSNEPRETSSLQFTPKVGYFISDKFALGIELSVGSSTLEESRSIFVQPEFKENSFRIGGFGRYYFLEVGSRFKTYTEVGAGYLSNRLQTFDSSFQFQDHLLQGFAANAGIGANFFLTEKIAVNFLFAQLISYQTVKPDLPNTSSISAFATNLNVFDNFFETARFGLTFKF